MREVSFAQYISLQPGRPAYPRFSPKINMKEFGKDPKFEHSKIVLRNQLIINLLRKYVYSCINFMAQE